MFRVPWVSRTIGAGVTACVIVMAVTAWVAFTASPLEPDTRPGGPRLTLVATDRLPSPDAQPGAIPGAAEPEDDQEPLAGIGIPTGRVGAPATRPARLARHLAHAPFAAPRSVPLRA